MGTRGLTVVIQNGEPKIAQYGQWDHYPSGHGVTALNFLSVEGNIDRLRTNLSKIKFLSDAEMVEAVHSITGGSGWMSSEEARKFNERFPFISRDHGADVLSLVANHSEGAPIHLRNDIEFAKDSLFCEWAYVVDLDTNTFEVHEGFQERRHTKGRFAVDSADERGYYPVALVASWSLDDLPTEEEFYERFGDDE